MSRVTVSKRKDEKKKTLPELTPLERARLIGERARQLEENAYTTLSKQQLRNLEKRFPMVSVINIATEELRLRVIPLKIIRVLPSGREEVWRITDFYYTPDVIREDVFSIDYNILKDEDEDEDEDEDLIEDEDEDEDLIENEDEDDDLIEDDINKEDEILPTHKRAASRRRDMSLSVSENS